MQGVTRATGRPISQSLGVPPALNLDTRAPAIAIEKCKGLFQLELILFSLSSLRVPLYIVRNPT